MTPRWAHLVAAGLLPGLVGGCYSYRPLPATPPPQTRVAVVLSDYGRVETAREIGPGTERVEGNVVSSDDSAYLLAVSSVKPLRGSWVRWSGEQVNVRRSYVAAMLERRLNKGRTALVIGAGAWTLLTAMVHFNILGFGAIDIPIVPGGGGDPGHQ
jgi:hypothetical protein